MSKKSKSKKAARSTLKTTPNNSSPQRFIASVENSTRKKDAKVLLQWFKQVTGLNAKMWGTAIIGYGKYRYEYESGRRGEWMIVGFSPRKASMSVYVMPGYRFGNMKEKLKRLGKHKVGKSCLYFNRLEDINMDVLQEIVEEGISYMRKNYPTWNE